jgi:hypothetical protein
MDVHRYGEELVNGYSFGEPTALDTTIVEVENFVAQHFCDGSVAVACFTLLTKQGRRWDWGMFSVGMRFGLMLLLVVWVIWDCVVDRFVGENNGVKALCRSFMSPLALLISPCLMSLLADSNVHQIILN